MDAIIEQVHEHLQKVTTDPSLPIDTGLLATLDGNIIQSLSSTQRHGLMTKFAVLLPTLQQDPTAAAELANSILEVDDTLTFTEVLEELEPDFVGGLEAPYPSLNLVTLSLLKRAAASAADAGVVATRPAVVAALVHLWLRTPESKTATKAQNVLILLLEAEGPGLEHENDGTPPPASPGLMWRRVFKDKDIYGSLYSISSTTAVEEQLTKKEKTTAQGRLLDLIQSISHAPQVWTSQLPEVEKLYGANCLLDFAAVHMVDFKEDVLAHMTLIEFFARLLSRHKDDSVGNTSTRSVVATPDSSIALDFLTSKGLHERTIAYFLEPERHEPLAASLLYSSAAHYISVYATNYPNHFLNSAAEEVLHRLSTVMAEVPSSAWANNRAPAHDLKLLSNLPQRALLIIDRGELLNSVPIKQLNPDALHGLALVFKGPSPTPLTFPARSSSPQSDDTDAASARSLFYLYISKHPLFWKELVSAASNTVLKESAIAAIALIQSIITSNWAPLPSTSVNHLPTERQLESKCAIYGHPLPPFGALAVLTSPSLEIVLPYLMGPSPVNSETAYEIAVAKHEALGALKRSLREIVVEGNEEVAEHWKSMLGALEQREGQGLAGARGQNVRSAVPVVGTIGR